MATTYPQDNLDTQHNLKPRLEDRDEEAKPNLGVVWGSRDDNEWTCYVCDKRREEVLRIDTEDKDSLPYTTYVCKNCLFGLVRDRRLAVFNATTYLRLANGAEEEEEATLDSDGSVSFGGFAINFG